MMKVKGDDDGYDARGFRFVVNMMMMMSDGNADDDDDV